jgi:DNA-binding winged helix-turn-helix (wHTH) protein
VTITFGPFALDPGTRQLTREGGEVVHLTPKAFELLEALVLERPNVVSKDALQHRLWPDTFVAEANLSNLVAEIREALDDSARTPAFIRTSHGIGYAFCAIATAHAPTADAQSQHPAGWLEWDRRRFLLPAGEHVIGRDADVQVRLDHTTVSRRHARIRITAAGAMLEDAGSKNGTFRGNGRVTTAVPLADGDLIGIGSLRLTFHLSTSAMTTDTQVP